MNASALILITLWLMADMIQRLMRPQSVHGIVMLVTALAAAVGNLAVAMSLRASSRGNLNIQTAYLHNLGDAAISLAPVVGGFVIARTGWTAVDSLIGLGIGVAVLLGTKSILKQSTAILLDHVPGTIQSGQVADALCAVPGVKNVHDLHIWSVSPTLRLLTCQLLVNDMTIGDSRELLRTARQMLRERFRIAHCTIQLETTTCHSQALYCNLARRHDHQRTETEPIETQWQPS